jgi:hypothetical protein
VSVDRDDRRNLRIRDLTILHDPEGRMTHSVGHDNTATPFRLYSLQISYVVNRSGGVEGYLAGEADWLSDAARELLSHYYYLHAE